LTKRKKDEKTNSGPQKTKSEQHEPL